MESRINETVCFASILTLSLIRLDCGMTLWRTPTVAADDIPLLTSKPLSVVICDNASVHHSAELVRMCHDAEFLLKYLPSYLPNLNPIETLFSVLKAWIKRHQDMAVLYFSERQYDDFLDLAFEVQEGKYNAGNLFRRNDIYYQSQDKMEAAEATEQ